MKHFILNYGFASFLRRSLLLALSYSCTSGCAMFDTDVPSLLKKDPEFVAPSQMIPLWSDTVLHTTGQPGMRGCGGRVMFYTPDSKEGVRVEGSVTVYAWNDSAPTKERKPDRKYVFKTEDLQKHYSKSKVGHSYSFWLPWDEAGGDRCELTIVARFVGSTGADIITPASKVILPGRIPMPVAEQDIGPSSEDRRKQRREIRQVAWEESGNRGAQRISSMKTSEIQLTPGFVERNQQATAVPSSLTADDLFGDSPISSMPESELATEPAPETSDGTSLRDVRAKESADEAESSEPPSGRRSVRLLQSRYRAQRERLARRVVGAQATERSPEELP